MNERRSKRALRRTLMVLLLMSTATGGCLGLVYVFQDRLLYRPNPKVAATPSRVGLAFDDVTLVTDDRVRLHGWHVYHANPRYHLIFFHGNAGNISHRLRTLKALHDLGAETLIFDYRGFGRSEGQPSERGTYLDAAAAWRYMIEHPRVHSDNIVLYGRSLGGAIAAQLAATIDARAVVVESSFASLSTLAQEVYPWLPTGQLLRYSYPSAEYLARTSAPVLIAHSEQDQLIGIHHGTTLFEAAAGPRYFYPLRGSHGRAFRVSGRPYLETLQRFFTAPSVDPVFAIPPAVAIDRL